MICARTSSTVMLKGMKIMITGFYYQCRFKNWLTKLSEGTLPRWRFSA